MDILLLGINYWPEETGIAVFNTGRCEYLAARGHRVTICTGFPYYPQWQIPPEYRGRLFRSEERNGVRILRSFLYVPRKVTSARRIAHEASFVCSSTLRALSGHRPDLLFVVSPPLALGLAGILLSRLWRIPYVFHVTDLQPDAAFELGMLPLGPVAKILYGLERLGYRHAGIVSTLTDGIRQRIVAKGVAADKVKLFSDWADPALFDVPLRGGGRALRERFALDDRFLVVHAGNMGVKQGLEVIVRAAELSRSDPSIEFLLVGDGARRRFLEEEAQGRKLTNLRFVPLLPRSEFLELLAAADVCLVTQQRSVAEIVFPSKVITLLAAGRPIVASVNPQSEIAHVVDRSGGGIVVEPEDAAVLADAIRELRDDASRLQSMGEQGRRHARDHWDRNRILPLMERELESLAASRGAAHVPPEASHST